MSEESQRFFHFEKVVLLEITSERTFKVLLKDNSFLSNKCQTLEIGELRLNGDLR